MLPFCELHFTDGTMTMLRLLPWSVPVPAVVEGTLQESERGWEASGTAKLVDTGDEPANERVVSLRERDSSIEEGVAGGEEVVAILTESTADSIEASDVVRIVARTSGSTGVKLILKKMS